MQDTFVKRIMSFTIRNQWLDILKNYIIVCRHKILFQILCKKIYNLILIVHLTSRW
jgi:hypothetical protein